MKKTKEMVRTSGGLERIITEIPPALGARMDKIREKELQASGRKVSRMEFAREGILQKVERCEKKGNYE